MKQLKIFPKTFVYTLGLMLFIVGIAHMLLYLFTKPEWLAISIDPQIEMSVSTSLNVTDYITRAVMKALPFSLICCVIIAVACSFWFSGKFTVPIKHISMVTEKMAQMQKGAVCKISTKDEIGILADNINFLYQSLLSTIENLETEKQRVSESEKSKADFLRAASHELKTPVTALNATLENMILGIGKYKDYDAYLPECKEITEHLAKMIHNILETSKTGIVSKNETAEEIDLSEMISSLCESYRLIARTKGIAFHIDVSDGFSVVLPPHMFEKVLSNVLANAVAYTETGGRISVYFDEQNIIVENECTPVPVDILQHLFEPFYRPDFDRNHEKGGNGLGLYIVDNFLKTLGISYSFLPMEEPPGMKFIINLTGSFFHTGSTLRSYTAIVP